MSETNSIYTVYKTTNLINNKIYVGAHKCKDPNDRYIGSGAILKRSIKKYGRSNFIKEVLFQFDNPDDMYLKESEIVDKDFVARSDTYNVTKGGHGSGPKQKLSAKQLMERNHADPTFKNCGNISRWNGPNADRHRKELSEIMSKRMLKIS